MTFRDAVWKATERLQERHVPEAELQARYLMWHLTGMNAGEWLLRKEEEAEESLLDDYKALVERRLRREPLQYILGEQEFMGLTFRVDPSVLIPRQDTEHLVARALPYCKGSRVLDMCTGSGCIAISIAMLGKPASVTAVDISEEALAVAKENASRLEADVKFVKSDMFAEVAGTYDVIVSNPPYIPPNILYGLMPEVVRHEPHIALYGGEDGLSFYRELAKTAKKYFDPMRAESGGQLFLEIGHDQASAVTALLQGEGYRAINVYKDYAGLDRVVMAQW